MLRPSVFSQFISNKLKCYCIIIIIIIIIIITLSGIE